MIVDYLKRALSRQPCAADFLPKITRHVERDMLICADGRLVATLKLDGLPAFALDERGKTARFNELRGYLLSAGRAHASKLWIWSHFLRRPIAARFEPAATSLPGRDFCSAYLSALSRRKLYRNEHYLTLILDADPGRAGLAGAIAQMRELIDFTLLSLSSYRPRALGLIDLPSGLAASEPLTLYSFLVNGGDAPFLPDGGDAYKRLSVSELHFGADLLERRGAESTRYGAMYDLRDFGGSKPYALERLLGAEGEFCLTQSFCFCDAFPMVRRIERHLRELGDSGDENRYQHAELLHGKGELQAGNVAFGDYAAALVVFDDDPAQAAKNGSALCSEFLRCGGFGFVRAGLSMPSTFFSQIPAYKGRPRSYPKSSANFASVLCALAEGEGKMRGNPLGDGTCAMPFETERRGLFGFNFHPTSPNRDARGEKTVGHTLALGATGAGKTTLECALMFFLERFGCSVFAFDSDRNLEIPFKAAGGAHRSAAEGADLRLNPFQFDDGPGLREFLARFALLCAQGQGMPALTLAEREALSMAVEVKMGLPVHLRGFSALLQSVPQDDRPFSLRRRLARWCRSQNGQYAHLFDHPRNALDFSNRRLAAFDVKSLLAAGADYPPTEPLLHCLFYLRDLMGAEAARESRPMLTIIEEFWFPAKFPSMAEKLVDLLKTERKKGGFCLFVSQLPEDAIGSRIFADLAQETATKIFLPNPAARFEGSYALCGLNREEFARMRALGLGSNRFLVKQGDESQLLRFDLRALKLGRFLPLLSGTETNSLRLRRLIAAAKSEDPQAWHGAFQKMCAAMDEAGEQGADAAAESFLRGWEAQAQGRRAAEAGAGGDDAPRIDDGATAPGQPRRPTAGPRLNQASGASPLSERTAA